MIRIIMLLIAYVATTFAASSYQDNNGLVVIEAENLTGVTTNWKKETTHTNYTGSSYIRWNGADNFNEPGSGIISTIIQINNPGEYRVRMRNMISYGDLSSEHNDTWLRFPDAAIAYGKKGNEKVYPKGYGETPLAAGASKDKWLKAFYNGRVQEWSWKTNTNDGDAYDIYVNFATAGEYTIQLSGRSKHHAVDRIVLHKSTIAESVVTNLSTTETVASANAGPDTKARIAVVADGNSPDPDDIGGTAVTLAILKAMGAEDQLVYYSHSCDLVRNNTRISAEMELQRQEMMQESCDGTAEKWGGFDHITFYNCRTQKTTAVNKLRDAINASSATDPLAIIEAGEPDIIYDAISAATASKRQYVTIVTHHIANDESADEEEKNLSNLIQEFTTINVARIPDQNTLLHTDISTWYWARDHEDARINWLWTQGKIAEQDPVVGFQSGYFDCSDAGMVYYQLTGDENPDVPKLKNLFTGYVADDAGTTPATYIYKGLTDFTNIEAGDAPYYKDNNNSCLGIAANVVEYRTKYAKARTTFNGNTGTYDITISTIAEYDGESTYKVYIDGRKVGEYKNTRVTEAQDMSVQTTTFKDISVTQGTTIAVESICDQNGLVLEGDSQTEYAWSRGRWRQIEFTTSTTEAENKLPLVSLTTPSKDMTITLGDSLTLAATASDEDGTITKVNFKINDAYYAQDAEKPYTKLWKPTAVGTYKVAAKAFDNDNGTKEVFYNVTVEIAVEEIAPVVSFLSPTTEEVTITYGDTTLSIEADVEDDNLKYTQLFINGNFLRKESVAPYEWGHFDGANNPKEFDTLSVGTHTITVVATDEDGLTGEASFTLTVKEPEIIEVPIDTVETPADSVSSSTKTNIEVNSELIAVYPNPARNFVFVNTEIEGKISIYNIAGSPVQTQHLASPLDSPAKIDVSNLPTGIYFITIKKDNTLEAVKSFYIRK